MANLVSAERLCFSIAKTYYEQLYCELEFRGAGSSLPGFYDFQRNNEMTQALLLKGPVKRLGVDLAMPVSSTKNTSSDTSATVQIFNDVAQNSCALIGPTIKCDSRTYHYSPNQRNASLHGEALTDKNLMNMPAFTASRSDELAVNGYVATAYEHYLEKMLSIGLAEATMSYGSFAYLFDDLNKKDVDFNARFEKMFFYLKKDKQQLAISVGRQPPATLVIDDCFFLQRLWVCERARKNYLYKSTD